MEEQLGCSRLRTYFKTEIRPSRWAILRFSVPCHKIKPGVAWQWSFG